MTSPQKAARHMSLQMYPYITLSVDLRLTPYGEIGISAVCLTEKFA